MTAQPTAGIMQSMNYAEARDALLKRFTANRAGLALTGAIALLVVSLALAIALQPLALGGTGAVSSGDRQPYPLRVSLPRTVVIPMEELVELAESDASLAPVVEQQQEALAAQAAQVARQGSRSSAQFAEAFGDIAPPARPAPEPNASGFIEVDYDLATLEPAAETYNRSDGSLTVEKPLFVDGKSSGAATIRIEEGAQILIATSSVARALGDRANGLPRRISGALASGTGFIPFYELRGAGIDVAYDPVNDRVSLSMPT